MRLALTISILVSIGAMAMLTHKLVTAESITARIIGTFIVIAAEIYGYKWYCENFGKMEEVKNEAVDDGSNKLETTPDSENISPSSEKSQLTPKTTVKLQEGSQQERSTAKKEQFKITRAAAGKFKQTPRKKVLNAKSQVSFTPPEVTYSEGVPKDIGFGRGDQEQLTGVWLSVKIYMPEVEGYSFIGRILGPRGISIRRLEEETKCKILIRGRGSIKDEKREQYLLNRAGWAHLHDKLHVLLLANDEASVEVCRERLENAAKAIQNLLSPQDVYDEYKRQQLMHLAILNGTYRP